MFVDAPAIRALNRKYLSRRYATDVLAFPLSLPQEKELVGDVIISTDAVVKNAARFKNPPAQELLLYIIHGLLHLLGYDDHKKSDILRMRAKEQQLVELIGAGGRSVLRP